MSAGHGDVTAGTIGSRPSNAPLATELAGASSHAQVTPSPDVNNAADNNPMLAMITHTFTALQAMASAMSNKKDDSVTYGLNNYYNSSPMSRPSTSGYNLNPDPVISQPRPQH